MRTVVAKFQGVTYRFRFASRANAQAFVRSGCKDLYLAEPAFYDWFDPYDWSNLPPRRERGHPDYGFVIDENSPKRVAYQFGREWWAAQPQALELGDNGVWYDLWPSHIHSATQPVPLNRTNPIPAKVLAERCWAGGRWHVP